MTPRLDLAGQRFGRLQAQTVIGRNKQGAAMWLCTCDCGSETTVRAADLRNGSQKSCGCLRRDVTRARGTTHGHSRPGQFTRTYKSWAAMIQRCTNPNNTDYDNYGGRGITVCDRWRNSFEDYLEDMGECPSKEYSIDRIDVNGNYEPGNCRWADAFQQAQNRRPPKLRSHCRHGHEFTPENTRIDSRGWRHCRTCHREQERERQSKENDHAAP